jgi:hypothetical protein
MPHFTSASAIGSLITLICFLSHAPRGQQGIVYSDFQTVGGITYALLQCEIEDCYSLNLPWSTRSGNMISQNLPLRGSPFCECLITPCPTHDEFAACPLGSFAAGSYTLSLQFLPQGRPPEPPLIVTFNVPEHGTRTLTVSRETNTVRLDVQGIAYCYYTIETSADLVNWDQPFTHQGAPFTYRDSLPDDQSTRFYRVRIDPFVFHNPVIVWTPW